MADLIPIYDPDLPQEEWRDVPTLPDYQVSNMGRLRSKSRRDVSGRNRRGRMVKCPPNTDGYFATNVRRDGQRVHVGLHRLVALAFIGPRPEGLQCCHNNGIKTDNRATNLRYDTPLNNNRDRITHGTIPRGSLVSVLLTDEDVRQILSLKGKLTAPEIAQRYSLTPNYVSAILRGEKWKHVYATTNAHEKQAVPPGGAWRKFLQETNPATPEL